MRIIPGCLSKVIVVGVLRAKNIWVGEETQIHTFDHIECTTFRSECDVALHSIEAKDWIEVAGRLGTFSCKGSRIHAGGAITAAKNLEAVWQISTLASINVGGHIICKKGPIMAADGINCGNTISAAEDITTTNGLCAGACTWRAAKHNNVIKAKSIHAGAIVGEVHRS